MTNEIPDIHVIQEVKKAQASEDTPQDVICLIGGFETDENYLTPVFYETLEDAEEDLYDGSESTLPDANKVLRQVFADENISGVLCVNVSVKSGTGSSITWARSVTQTKLENSLAAVAPLEFNLLYVAEEITDGFATTIDTDAKARFEDKMPYGWIGVGTRNNASAYGTTADKLGDFCYAFLTQALTINNTSLSLLESGAWLTNYIARLPLGDSLTAKVISEITNVGTTYTFESGDIGETLVGLGFFVVRLLNPLQGNYECVNSACANGLDLYINRSRDYIVNDFALRQFLGDKNNKVTLDGVKMECNDLVTKFVKDLKIAEGIKYTVEKKNSKSVNVILNTIQFADIITDINVYMTIEVV